MKPVTLHVITACSRFGFLPALAQNVAALVPQGAGLRVRWHVFFQAGDQPDLVGAVKNNEALNMLRDDDWVWILDDDNFVHPRFFGALRVLILNHPDKRAFVFSQNRRDVLGPLLPAAPQNMKLGRVDTAQVVFQRGLLCGMRFREDTRTPDGFLYEDIYEMDPDAFMFVDEALVNYNWGRP